LEKPDVVHGQVFAREFKIEAVRLIRERGVSVAEGARDLEIHENVPRRWAKERRSDASAPVRDELPVHETSSRPIGRRQSKEGFAVSMSSDIRCLSFLALKSKSD
jgi:transposase